MKTQSFLLLVLCLFCQVFNAHAQNLMYFTSAPESWVGHGQSYYGNDFTVRYGPYRPIGDANIEVNFQSFSLWLIGPNRERIVPKMYNKALRALVDEDFPGMFLMSPGRADNYLTGWFNVLELRSSTDTIESTAIDFMVFDEGIESWWNFGSIRYNSEIPINTIPEPSSFGLLLLGATVFIFRRKSSS